MTMDNGRIRLGVEPKFSRSKMLIQETAEDQGERIAEMVMGRVLELVLYLTRELSSNSNKKEQSLLLKNLISVII
jgi:hypothetical protein